jgi:hypothetical protein
MEEYLVYHTNAMKNILQNCSLKQNDFIIFQPHHYSGFGNILMGLIPTLLYALLS